MTYQSLADVPEFGRLHYEALCLGEMLEASRHGARVPLESVAKRLQQINVRVDELINTFFPTAWQELKDERARDAQVKADTDRLVQLYPPPPSIGAIKSELLQWAEIEGIAQKVKRGGPGMPLLRARPDLAAPAAFFCAQLTIPLKRLPTFRMRSKDSMPVWGCYVPRSHSIHIRVDVPEGNLLDVLAHEIAHAKEGIQGWSGSEPYAEQTAARLVRKWYAEGRKAA